MTANICITPKYLICLLNSVTLEMKVRFMRHSHILHFRETHLQNDDWGWEKFTVKTGNDFDSLPGTTSFVLTCRCVLTFMAAALTPAEVNRWFVILSWIHQMWQVYVGVRWPGQVGQSEDIWWTKSGELCREKRQHGGKWEESGGSDRAKHKQHLSWATAAFFFSFFFKRGVVE